MLYLFINLRRNILTSIDTAPCKVCVVLYSTSVNNHLNNKGSFITSFLATNINDFRNCFLTRDLHDFRNSIIELLV